MEFGLFTKVVDEISGFRPLPSVGLNFSGESLLHPRFLDALVLLKERGLISGTGFNTNASFLNPEVAEAIVESHVRSVSVSLDGFKASHERIRVGSRYDRVVENTMFLVAARRRRGATHPHIVVNLTRVDQDESEIAAFVAHWAPLVDEVRVYEQLSADSRLVTTNPLLDQVLSTRRMSCSQPWQYIAVLADGSITLCCHDILGVGGGFEANAADTSILAIWNGRGYRRLRHLILKGHQASVPACAVCEAWAAEYVCQVVSTTDKYLICRSGLGVSYRQREEPASR